MGISRHNVWPNDGPNQLAMSLLAKHSNVSALREKKTYGYWERDEAKRAAFLEQLADYTAAEVVYVEEAGVDDTHDYPYGYCHHSERFYALKLGHRTERVSMVAGWCNREVVAPMTFKGYCNTGLIEAWLEQILVPELTPGQVVIMDNASFHQSSRIQTLIEQAKCRLLFLPPYSPDFNKIEKFWARLKGFLGKSMQAVDNLWDAVDDAFRQLS